MATYTTWNNNNVSLPDSWTRGYNTVRWYFGSTTTRYIQVLRGTTSGFSRYVNWGDYNYIDFVTIVSSMYSYDYSRSQYYYDYTMDCSEWSGNGYYCQFMMATSYSNPSTVYCYKANNGGEFYVSFGSTPTKYPLTIELGTGINYLRGYWSDASSTTVNITSNTTHEFSSSGGFFYINKIYYDNGYTYPVTQTYDSQYTSNIINADGSWATHRTVGVVSTNGRTVTIDASTYSLTVKLGTGVSYLHGYWSDELEYMYLSDDTTHNFATSTGYFYIDEVGYSTYPYTYTYPVNEEYNIGSIYYTNTLINSNNTWESHTTEYGTLEGRDSTISATRGYSYYAKLTYNANRGSGAPSPQTGSTVSSGSSANITFVCSSSTPTRSGYRFLGWANLDSATTPDYYGGNNVTVTSTSKSSSNPTEKIIYAVWEQTGRIYEVELVDGFGATCDTLYSPTTTASSYTFTVPSYSASYPSHNGYVFRTWKQGSTEYAPSSTITCDTETPAKTLTAQWNVDTDTFYLQLGTITSSSITVRITGLTAKSYARTVEFVCNGVTKTVTVSANSTSSSYVTFTGLSSEGGYEINATLKVGSLTLGSNYIDAYPLLNFAWTNIIAQGYPISNLTASDWNEYNRLLTIKAIRHSKTHSYTTVSSGTIIYATYYNAVCNSLRNINSSYNINNVSSGDQVIATPFNTMVTYLNTDDN